MKGIDVSNYNGNVNWSAVKNAGFEAVYIKATEGTTYVDPYLNNHYNGASGQGLNIGFYHFLTGTSAPETQAENFYNAIKNRNSNLKPCIDIERTGFDVNGYIRRFAQKFSTLSNASLIIYTGAYFARDNISSDIKGSYPLWVAHYGVAPWGSNINTGFGTICGHQYTDKGSISGASGYFDLDVFNDQILTGARQSVVYVHNAKISELQGVCNSLLNAGLAVDGYWGPATDAAVRRLPLAGIPYRTPQLTTWIQLRLGILPDGIFGSNTRNAVVWWQKNHGLSVDGIVGYNTIKSLAYA